MFNEDPNANMIDYFILPKLSSEALYALLSCMYVTAPGYFDSLVSFAQFIIAPS